MSERVRFTISVDPEVHDAFADLAHSAGVSLSRCVGDWLRDTSEAAQITTIKVNEARKAPDEIVRAYRRLAAEDALDIQKNGRFWGAVAGLGRGHGAAVPTEGRRVSRGVETGGAADRHGAPAQPVPPSSLTGGKSPGKTLNPKGAKS